MNQKGLLEHVFSINKMAEYEHFSCDKKSNCSVSSSVADSRGAPLKASPLSGAIVGPDGKILVFNIHGSLLLFSFKLR